MSPVAVESREFLTTCLKAALDDPDLVDAISDQAFEQGFSADSIGSGKVTLEDLKDKLYLTMEEAKSVLNICTSMLAGANKAVPQNKLSVGLHATPSGHVALSFQPKGEPEPAVEPVLLEPVPYEPLDVMLENAAVVVVSRASANASEKKLQMANEDVSPSMGSQLVTPEAVSSPAPKPASVPQPVLSSSPVPESVPPPEISKSPAMLPPPASKAPAPSPLAAKASAASPSPAQSPAPPPPAKKPSAAPTSKSPAPTSAAKAPAAPSPAAKSPAVPPPSAKSPAPKSPAPKSPAIFKPTELFMPEPCPSSPRIPCSAGTPSPSTPSYLRPTAAHKARTSKDATGGIAASPPAGLPPVSEESSSHELSRRRNLFSRMASTLMAPTQAFVARVTGRNDEVKTKKEGGVCKTSAHLDALLCSPQGQRVTKPQPFALRSETRSKSCVLSTEELQLAEAREKAFKRKPVPKHVHEPRPIAPVQRTAPKDPSTVFEPFQLASLELHKKTMERMRQKQEEEAREEEQKRQFKARAFDAKVVASPSKPAKKPASPPTRAVAPVLASEARIAHYHAVVQPAKKAKEAEANKEKAEADLKAKELEEMSNDEYRKTLEFKARRMPDFSAPFQPDPMLARPATIAVEPELCTTKRLGAPPSPAARDDKEGSGLGKGVFDGAGYADPFAASLRKSTSISSHASSNGGFAGLVKKDSVSSLRRSFLIRAASAASGGPGSPCAGGSGKVRASAGTDLQAAIRAAARDAARDLAAAGCSVDATTEA